MTSRLYHHPDWLWRRSVRNCHASVVFVRLSRGAFSVQVRLTALYTEIYLRRPHPENVVQCSVTVVVGRNLTSGDPYSDSPSSTEGGTEPLAAFVPLQDRNSRIESDVALHDVRVPFHGTSGPEVTLRIVLTEHYHLRTYLLHLDVLDFEVARRDYCKSQVPESNSADMTAS